MAKDAAKTKERSGAEETDTEDGDGVTEGEGGKKVFIKKLLSNKKMMIAAAGTLVLVMGGGAGAYIFLSGGKDDAVQHDKTAHAEPVPIVPPKVAFYDMPAVVVNIQSQDGSPAYLKLSVALELQSADEVPGLKVLMPRVVDQFQGYLRELRVDDLRGSESVMRLKEELLRRINAAAAPYRVHDVLLKEMIVQ